MVYVHGVGGPGHVYYGGGPYPGHVHYGGNYGVPQNFVSPYPGYGGWGYGNPGGAVAVGALTGLALASALTYPYY
jgi:hypothetical protein